MDDSTQNQFSGAFEHGVDDKGRVVIPLEFRGLLGEEFVATHGPDQAIWILPNSVWDDIQKELQSKKILDTEAGHLFRLLFGGKTVVKLDPQCRLAIPKLLREYADVALSSPAIIVGAGSRIEIWSKSLWTEFVRKTFNSARIKEAAHAAGLLEE
jgi:MraZ protein